MLACTILVALATVSYASPGVSLPPQEVLGDSHVLLWNGGGHSSCGRNGPSSCSNNTEVSNLCCFEYPGGLLTLTQFWDYSPSSGPTDSWTIHGLWPDNCDGSFNQDCDRSRVYTDISGLLSNQGATDTLSFMETYWVDINGNNERFWQHEWGKHGTCYSTLDPTCLPDDSPAGAEAVAFFQTVVNLFQQYNIYQALAAAGITPSTRNTYTESQLEAALGSAFGVKASFDCTHGHNLNQIYVYFTLRGSIIDGAFNPIDTPKRGNCPPRGIQYVPK